MVEEGGVCRRRRMLVSGRTLHTSAGCWVWSPLISVSSLERRLAGGCQESWGQLHGGTVCRAKAGRPVQHLQPLSFLMLAPVAEGAQTRGGLHGSGAQAAACGERCGFLKSHVCLFFQLPRCLDHPPPDQSTALFIVWSSGPHCPARLPAEWPLFRSELRGGSPAAPCLLAPSFPPAFASLVTSHHLPFLAASSRQEQTPGAGGQ